MYFLLQGNPSMGSMESMGCAEAKKQLFVKTAMFKVCTVLIYFTPPIPSEISEKNWSTANSAQFHKLWLNWLC